MSSSSAAVTDLMTQSTILPTTTTFLPILDDLLSPDFRPVTHPPIVTPLQTPTTNVTLLSSGVVNGMNVANNNCNKAMSMTMSMSNGAVPVKSINFSGGSGGVLKKPEDHAEAAAKIQKWWKRNRSVEFSDDFTHERAKHSIRHSRTEEHIRHLESEVSRLKTSLTAERKLRSLQYEAIRSLWSQIQKLSGGSSSSDIAANSIMSQSLPNGLPLTSSASPPTTAAAAQPHHCDCALEISELKRKIESEVGELRGLVTQLVTSQTQESSSKEGSNEQGGAGEESPPQKRPDTLDLGTGGGKPLVQHKPEEVKLQGYADDMAKYVLERGKMESGDGGADDQASSCGGGGGNV